MPKIKTKTKKDTDKPDRAEVTVSMLVAAMRKKRPNSTVLLNGIMDNFGTDYVVMYKNRTYSAVRPKGCPDPELRITHYDGTAEQLAALTGRHIGEDLVCLDNWKPGDFDVE